VSQGRGNDSCSFLLFTSQGRGNDLYLIFLFHSVLSILVEGRALVFAFTLYSCCHESGHPARRPHAGALRAHAQSRPVFSSPLVTPLRDSHSPALGSVCQSLPAIFFREGFAARPSTSKIFLHCCNFVVLDLVKNFAGGSRSSP
jgi:hypothetical protein